MTINKTNSLTSASSIKSYHPDEQRNKVATVREFQPEVKNLKQENSVFITEDARHLQQDSQDINQQKIERIKQAINNGSFTIQAEKIADKLINQTILDLKINK
ncbi:flagellar biosynthesis anti-sigma factor FlgM [Moellerella wisconsensis]|uniref:flagellar biosynthesis anti-sigma factor FlgM n=1 Tax=Moellerella wisconsensis TaxID=158849 RepID=UPI003076167C